MPCSGHPQLKFLRSKSPLPSTLESLALQDLTGLHARCGLTITLPPEPSSPLQFEMMKLCEWLREAEHANASQARTLVALVDGGVIEFLVSVIMRGRQMGCERADAIVSRSTCLVIDCGGEVAQLPSLEVSTR